MNERARSPTLSAAASTAAAVLLVAALASSGRAATGPASNGMAPPDSCRSRACLEGADAFHRGDYRKAAERLEQGIWSEHPAAMNFRAYSDMLLLAALSRERAGDWARAGGHFDQLSKLVDAGADFYAYRALRAYLKSDGARPKLLRQLERRGALATSFPGAHRLRLAYRKTVDAELPRRADVRQALEHGTTREVCTWLSEAITSTGSAEESTKRRASLAQLLYGYCLPPRGEDAYSGQPQSPSNLARVRRAERLYDRVQFEEALAELQKVDFAALDRPEWCRGRFRLGRTHYRLDHHSKSSDVYRTVVDKCGGAETAPPRIRSLYALGRRHYNLDQFEKSKKHFKAILEEYPERSHADDALMYLGRIARAQNDRDRVRTLVERALERYPDGDMVHEFVWEYVEPTFRAGDYETFVDELDALDLPNDDDEYYSQGRLAFYRARAELELGMDTAATERLRTTWRRYPFSFYGYLARLKLRDRDAEIPSLRGEAARTVPRWFFDPDWNGTSVRHALQLGLPEVAAAMETGRTRSRRNSDDSVGTADRWRLAFLHYRAGHYVECHNIPRRQIQGRPWVDPARGRRVRWRVAFPDPYRGRVEQAVDIESRQRPKARVSPHLPMAIMREESGFDVDIESWAGAVGLMQLMPSTARGHDSDVDVEANQKTLRKAGINIRIGVDHLHLLARYFSDHPVVMVAAYNAGMGAVRDWLPESSGTSIATWVEDVPYRQTRNYAKRVIGSYAAYQWLAGRHRLDPAVGDSPPVD